MTLFASFVKHIFCYSA